MRGDPRHFTHSKVMAWVAFDRAIRTVEEFGLDGPADHWRDLREQLHHQVCREAFDPELEYAFRPSLNAGTEATVLGVLSLVFWAVILVVALKYVVFVMRADNHSEGGTMALLSLAVPAAGRAI